MTTKGNIKAVARPQTIGDRVYDELRDHILFSDAPATLFESELTKQLQVSRTPVREALTKLASEGYIIPAERGYQIPAITPNDIENMFELRELLEPVAARHAAENLSNFGFAEMESAIQAEMKAHQRDDVSEYVSANSDFRKGWLLRVRNPLLLEALSRTMRPYSLLRFRILRSASFRVVSMKSHSELLSACKLREPDTAMEIQKNAILQMKLEFNRNYHYPSPELVASWKHGAG